MKSKSIPHCSPCLVYLLCFVIILFGMYSYFPVSHDAPQKQREQRDVKPNVDQRLRFIHNVPYARRIFSGIPADYTVVGYLKNDVSDAVYPLYGRASPTNSSRWNYHTMTDRLSGIKLPVRSTDGRDCTLDMGCDELYDGHTVTIPGFDTLFYVYMYPKTLSRC